MGYAGFLMFWDTDANGDGQPETVLKLYRRDAASTIAPKPLYLVACGHAVRSTWRQTTRRPCLWYATRIRSRTHGRSRRFRNRSRSRLFWRRSLSPWPVTKSRPLATREVQRRVRRLNELADSTPPTGRPSSVQIQFFLCEGRVWVVEMGHERPGRAHYPCRCADPVRRSGPAWRRSRWLGRWRGR